MTVFGLYFINKNGLLDISDRVAIEKEGDFFNNTTGILVKDDKHTIYFLKSKSLAYYNSTINKLKEESTILKIENKRLKLIENFYKETNSLFD